MKIINRSFLLIIFFLSSNLIASDSRSVPAQVNSSAGSDRGRQMSENSESDYEIAPGRPVRIENLIDLRSGAQNLLNKLSSSHATRAWTDPELVRNVTVIKAAHIQEIRGAVKEFYREYCAEDPLFTDDPLVAGVTPVKAIHFTELKDKIDNAPLNSLCSPPAASDISGCSPESGGARVCWGSGANIRCRKMPRNYQCP